METNKNLKTLSILHKVWAGLKLFSALLMPLVFIFGIWMYNEGYDVQDEELKLDGLFYAIYSVILFFILIVSSVMSFLCASFLKKQKNRIFCLVMSGLAFLSAPLGIALGIFTILEIEKPEVKALFEENKSDGLK
jgi:hypothetical protein